MKTRHQPIINTRRSPAAATDYESEVLIGGMFFATGIENSNPTINNGRIRVDEMESCGHYEKWSTDFDKVQELGLSFCVLALPYIKRFLGQSRYDWSFADTTFADL